MTTTELHDEHVYAAKRHANDMAFADITPSHRSQGDLVRSIAAATVKHGKRADRDAAAAHLARLG